MFFKLFWLASSIFLISLISIFGIIFFDLLGTDFKKEENAIYYSAKNIKKAKFNLKLKVMTWNIKFGAAREDMFFDCHGNKEIIPEKEVIKNLDNIIKKINEISPDILFLQEVDINSHRSGYVNQAKYILDNTDLNYGYYASQWKALFIPSHNIGKINSGNLILSKFKLYNGKRYALPKIASQNLIVQYFYLKRNFLVSELRLKDKKITLINTHLSAYANDETKERQVNALNNFINGLSQDKKRFILAGDFNTLPPGTIKVKNFPDNACKENFNANDFSNETELLSPIYNGFNSAIPLRDYQKNNTPYFTHSTDKKIFWNRKLDYIFSNMNMEKGKVLQKGTMPLSDHAPLTVEISLD